MNLFWYSTTQRKNFLEITYSGTHLWSIVMWRIRQDTEHKNMQAWTKVEALHKNRCVITTNLWCHQNLCIHHDKDGLLLSCPSFLPIKSISRVSCCIWMCTNKNTFQVSYWFDNSSKKIVISENHECVNEMAYLHIKQYIKASTA